MMGHVDLDRPSRGELVDLLLRQGEVIGRQEEEELTEREAAIERREKKIRALVEGLLRLRRPVKRPENPSGPPSQRQKANWRDGRRRELVPNAGTSASAGCAASRTWSSGAPRARVRNLARRCRRPGDGELAPLAIQARQYAMTCAECGEQTVSAYPAGLEPHRTFEPGIEAHVSYFHERHHVGYERLVEVCRDVFGLAISQGGVENALRLVERGRPTYDAFREAVRGSPVIHPDETGAGVAGRTQ